VAGLPGGIIRSGDNGRSWHPCWIDQTNAPVTAISLSANYANDRVLLAATDGDGILRSTDGGNHWELANFGLRDFNLLALETAPLLGRYDYVFALSESSVYHSPNGGRAWRRLTVADDIQPLSLAISPHFAHDQTVYVGSESGELFASHDAGHSWQLAATLPDPINALTFAPDGTLLSAAGETIANLQSPISDLPSPILTMRSLNQTLYAGLFDGLVQSDNNGRSWQPVPHFAARRFVWFLPTSASRWLAAGPDEGIWQSDNGGQSWQPLWEDGSVLALAASQDQLWLSLPDGVAFYENGAWQLAFASDDPVVALAIVANGVQTSADEHEAVVWAGSARGHLWRNGRSVSAPFPAGQLLGMWAHEGSVLTAVWHESTLQIWRSDDDGTSWQSWFNQPAATPLLPQLVFAPDGTALVGSGSDLYWQRANGQTPSGWRRQRLASQAAPITALWAGSGGYLAALTDKLVFSADGERWQPTDWLAGEPVVALTAVPGTNTLLAGTADGRLWQTAIPPFIDTQ
jgi:photosystem II stability/assembly factor-like uncharacterized protein